MTTNTASIQSQASASERVKAAAAALALGAVLIFTVGFAHSTSVHNAAHDTRHTLAFPCH
ncbi:CbtB domain-containing protein [Bosea sp. (in: a-proteobacteria)]|jgi:cobalt transporter subunit CbtB|uniref:CbtB domain-containing protein n=1 Tax=Bosea sp. (in: a-proteobacteria) TaxID=1871050 RepID=UPI003F705883